MCLDEHRASGVDLHLFVPSRSSLWKRFFCCDVQGHSKGDGMSLVLASLSSAFYHDNSKICRTKKTCCELRSEAPLAPLILARRCCEEISRSKSDFSTFAVTCKLFFDPIL